MGERLWRVFLSFPVLSPAEELADWKLATNSLEENWALGGCRRVNIDPGYVAVGKIVLASTKDAPHRVFVGRGIYAEVTLVFQHGAYRPLPHTYPDYTTPTALEFLAASRQDLLRDLRKRRVPTP